MSQSIAIFILHTINRNNIHAIKIFNHKMIYFKSHGGCKRYLSFCEIFITTNVVKYFLMEIYYTEHIAVSSIGLCYIVLYYFQRNFATFISLVVFIEV